MNTVWQNHQASPMPVLSVLIPFYKDNPLALLKALGTLEGRESTEIILYDDGSKMPVINSGLKQLAKTMDISITLIEAQANKGRSFARNALKQRAGADWILYLDADMRPTQPDFLNLYLEEIAKGNSDIVFGGFEVLKQSNDKDKELHRVFSEKSDCLDAATREKAGPQFVCSSNLCVRKAVLDAEPFDAEFSGWGWEDSEWAARVSQDYTLKHIDNPALHLGLESVDSLLSRFANSGANYRRFTNAHPELAKSLTLYKLSQRLRRLPAQKLMRPVLKALVKAGFLPARIRMFALKLWRASWYAEALS